MMIIKRCVIVVLGLFILSSCTHSPRVAKKRMDDSVQPMVTGIVLNADVLAEGGTLAFEPLKAGPKAEATDELDRFSIMLLKGIKELLKEQKTSLQLIDEDNEGQPDFILGGYVQEFSHTGKVSRMMMRRNQDSLVLEGEIWLRSNGERLLAFSARKKFNPKKEKLMTVAYELGQEIGRFIAAHTSYKKEVL